LKTKYVDRVGKGGKVIVTRLKPNNDLLQSIKSLVEKEGIKAGVILSGIGLLKKASIRNCKVLPKEFPITDANRSFLTFQKPLEILSLSGNISEVKGEPLVHAHITLSYVEGEEISVIGGHLIEGCLTFGFVEIFIMELKNIKLEKEFDPETKTLQLFVS